MGKGTQFRVGLPTSNHGIFSPSKWVKEPSSEQACPPAITGSSPHPNGERNPVQSRPAHQQSRDLFPIQNGKGTQFRGGLPTSNHGIFSASKWVKEPSSEQACPPAITYVLPIQMGKGTQFRAGLPTSNHVIFSPSKWVKEPSSEQACPQAITGSSPHSNG